MSGPPDYEDAIGAYGLSDEDITELLKLVRSVTNEKIISLSSRRSDAEIRTGFLADGETGAGKAFSFVRTETGWAIKESSEWMA